MMYGWHGGWGILAMVIFWGVVLGVVVWAIAAATRSAGGRPPERTAKDILKERFARGEITREEFEERRRVLESR
jgi:putative membrane protein